MSFGETESSAARTSFGRPATVLVYVAYSDRVFEGSPKNSISSVPIMAWPEP